LRGSAEADLGFLSAALSNASGAVRCAAVEALTDLGGARAAEAVAFASTDEEPEVCRAAVAALGRMRSEHGTAVGLPRLVELVERSTDPELLEFAIRALSETHAPEAAEVLRPLLRSSQPLLAVCAVEALAELSVESAADALLDGLQHAEPEVVKAAMQALSERPSPQAIARIGACLEHEAWDVRRLAADLLGRVSGDIALGLLRARLAREDSPTVQAAIGRALERIAGIRRTPPPGSFRQR
ncbi:MAG TPA: HEAT repeat domain-containing protein, partial [Polyangiaceae bacterium]|nr:HEAT repeat domain-containing protein [Polyangiaceae bacterium]